MTTFRSTKNKLQNVKEVTKGNLMVLCEVLLAARADLNMRPKLPKIDKYGYVLAIGMGKQRTHDCINLTAGRARCSHSQMRDSIIMPNKIQKCVGVAI